MEYIYATLLLHKLGKEINEENIRKVIEAAGAVADEAKIKVLLASLKGVDIEKELAEAEARKEEKVVEKEIKEEKEKKEEAAEGLAALFA